MFYDNNQVLNSVAMLQYLLRTFYNYKFSKILLYSKN